jgi:hypothetical protein
MPTGFHFLDLLPFIIILAVVVAVVVLLVVYRTRKR